MNTGRYAAMSLLVLMGMNGTANERPLFVESVGQFFESNDVPPNPWEVVRFDEDIPATVYRIVEWDGVMGIEAKADDSMALLARPLAIDLQRTPVLCWQWRVDGPLETADMNEKSGDDYAARLYVAFDLPDEDLGWRLRWKLKLARSLFGDHVPEAAVNYVWDNRNPIGTTQANAYTDRAQMMVLQTGAEQAGRWVRERRNVLDDVVQAFGDGQYGPVSIAVASDTDNTGESAWAGFADIHFVPATAQCQWGE